MQAAINNQNLHISMELNSVQQKHEHEVQQIQAQQARQAREHQREQMERQNAAKEEIAKLTADLEKSHVQGQLHAQRANKLRESLAEQRDPPTPSISPTFINTPTSMPPVPKPPPAAHPPQAELRRDIFSNMRRPAGGDPMPAGGDSKQEQAPTSNVQQDAAKGRPLH